MKPRLFAEVSSNHQRDLARALRFVDAAAALGCAGVKFQQFEIERLFAPEALRARPELREREAWQLPEEFNAELSRRAHARGIQFASTPFHLEAVELLAPWVDVFKVASYQILWHDLLREVAASERPVVLATGMADLEEVRAAVEVLREGGCADLTLLHCVSAYPTPVEQANLAAIRTLRESFGLPVGWSDHTVNPEAVARAVRVFGAELVEFHFDLDGQGEEFCGGHCWMPADVRALSRALEDPRCLPPHHPADGDGCKEPREIEATERRWRSDPCDGLRPLVAVRAELAAEGVPVA